MHPRIPEFPDAQSRIRGSGADASGLPNASNSEPAKLSAVFVADEGAELSTLIG
jgi:hypothetical protein